MSEELEIKRVKVDFKFANAWKDKIKLVNPASIKLTYSSGNKKILFISNKLLKSSISEGLVIDSSALFAFKNMLGEMKKYGPELKEALIMPYTYSSFNGLSSKLRSDLENDYKKNIVGVIKKV